MDLSEIVTVYQNKSMGETRLREREKRKQRRRGEREREKGCVCVASEPTARGRVCVSGANVTHIVRVAVIIAGAGSIRAVVCK